MDEIASSLMYNVAGLFSIQELVASIDLAAAVLSVNTAISHVAAAANTPIVVLYSLPNPPHMLWKTNTVMLAFSVKEELKVITR